MIQPNDPSTADAARIADVLAIRYLIPHTVPTRLPIGQNTINYRVEAADRTLFVKQYLAGTDLAAEEAAIVLTRLAGERGVPVAAVVPDYEGRDIAEHDGIAVSVWDWVSGQADGGMAGLNFTQQAAAGAALGRIHRAFADIRPIGPPDPDPDAWLRLDAARLTATIDRLLGIIHDRGDSHDPFDDEATRTLIERRAVVTELPRLISGLPSLTSQVLHGDYSAVNLLFEGDRLAAVLDFRPPRAFFVAYEVGRIAFDPRTVLNGDQWIEAGATLVAAYIAEHPAAKQTDILACARTALIQLTRSLYGVKNHYLNPGLLQDDLDAFWLLRHRAAQRLWAQLDEVESALEHTLDSA